MLKLRKPITNSERFKIFERDSFTCQYCGRKAPDTIIAVDHRIPVAAGGDNSPDNLVTACFDCNSGKAARIITGGPQVVQDAVNDTVKDARQAEAIISEARKRHYRSKPPSNNRRHLKSVLRSRWGSLSVIARNAGVSLPSVSAWLRGMSTSANIERHAIAMAKQILAEEQDSEATTN